MNCMLKGFSLLLASGLSLAAAEYHVSLTGNDAAAGTKRAPLRTIQKAAELAQPGDVITVRAGIYRERVNPPRGGTSEKERITYQAARGEKVEIRGSERVTGWTRVQGDVWKVALPNTFFKGFNPYTNLIKGDWFDPKGRPHHTGAVYLNGHWLVEAAKLDEVLNPSATPPAWWGQSSEQYLLNVAWFRPDSATAPKIAAASFSGQRGVQTAGASEGGQCIGWIDPGDWAQYERVDLGARTERLEFRVASAGSGGLIEVRLDGPEGELLGTANVPGTGDWQQWTSVRADVKPTRGVHNVCLLFKRRPAGGAQDPEWARTGLWFAEVDAGTTTIYAQFKGADPNAAEVEINVRQTVFYPDQPGRNYLTVRGFILRNAATQWAPPTAEQTAVIGTHWSKGWVIEDNVVCYSVCSGISLGKHGDEFDNTSQDTAEGYVKTIERGHARGWTRDNIGHHTVRRNTIAFCEQAGIVGSLGAAFSTVTDNTIHDIHMRRLFTGAEMAGIKFHAAIDSTIRNNRIYRTCLGLWLDWMAQGTRVSQNLFYDNGRDLFVEVNHGPFMVDNNLFLSGDSLLDVSEGGAYAHNLFNGRLVSAPEPNRDTPYHPAHSTVVAGLVKTTGGDNRFYNNIFVGRGSASGKEPSGFGLSVYDKREYPLFTGGNVYLNGAQPYAREVGQVVLPQVDPGIRVVEEKGSKVLHLAGAPGLNNTQTALVGTAMLGSAKVPKLPYVNADGSPFVVDFDFRGKKRDKMPTPGPFENLKPGMNRLTLD
jgi:hypothetical protein